MANTIKTLKDGDITRKALSILHNKLVFCKTINRQYDDRFAKSGAKNGGELLIREPNQFTVRSGATLDTQDVEESTQTLTVATRRGVDVNFSTEELTLSMDDFSERILEPAMSRLAAEIDKVVITASYKDVYNYVPGTLAGPSTLADVASARSFLSKGLAPEDNRSLIAESLSMNKIVDEAKALFHPASEIEQQWNKGYVGRLRSFKAYESETVPNHTHGTRTDTTPVCNTSTGITSGTATITTTGYTSGHTLTQGDVFTVEGVYAVNPETKVRYPHYQRFTVTAAKTLDGTDVVAVSPTPITSGAKQNVEIVSAGASKAVENLDFGTNAATYIQNMAYHRDAFTLVTADLVMPKGVDMGSRAVYDGISLRVIRDYDIINDKLPCRMDVLFGYKTLRPEWAARLSAD